MLALLSDPFEAHHCDTQVAGAEAGCSRFWRPWTEEDVREVGAGWLAWPGLASVTDTILGQYTHCWASDSQPTQAAFISDAERGHSEVKLQEIEEAVLPVCEHTYNILYICSNPYNYLQQGAGRHARRQAGQ